jgi:hypothetical protein
MDLAEYVLGLSDNVLSRFVVAVELANTFPGVIHLGWTETGLSVLIHCLNGVDKG